MRKTRFAAALLVLVILQSAPARADQNQLPPPIAVVTDLLALSEAQTGALIAMIQSRDAAIRPIAEALQAKQAALGKLLETPGADAASVGQLLIEIHNGQQQASALAQAAAAKFDEVLTPGQRERLQAIRQAEQLAPAIPAFKAVGLL
ncbi:MAG: periplasmic heavy metal sensor [Thermoanaerobaculia bacterium]